MTFGKFIRHKRIALGFSQQNLANVCLNHSNRSDICKLEDGKIEWKLRDIEAIASLFGLSLTELFSQYEKENKND